MTTLPDRPHIALLVIDMQRGVVSGAHDRDAVVGRIAALVERARAAGAPLVWVQHADDQLERGSPAWRLIDELTPRPDEPLVHKAYPDAFEDTDLEPVLARLGVGRLIVAGAQTDQCIRATLHGGLVRGYDVTLVSDAHTTEDLSAYGAPPPAQVIAHTNLSWGWQRAPQRRGTTVAAADVELSSPAD